MIFVVCGYLLFLVFDGKSESEKESKNNDKGIENYRNYSNV